MKKATLYFILSFLVFSITSWASPITDTEIRSLDDFSKVTVATGINLILIPGNENVAKIEVSNMDLSDIITKVDGNRLVIKIKSWNVNFKKKYQQNIDVTLTYEEINQLSAKTGASVSSNHTLASDFLDLSASTGAEIDLDIESDQVYASATTGSEMRLNGECNSLEAKVNTGSEMKCSGLEAAKVEAKASTGSEIKVWATESLYAKANTGGEIKYKGSPDVKKKKGTGGSVRKI